MSLVRKWTRTIVGAPVEIARGTWDVFEDLIDPEEAKRKREEEDE